MSDDPARIIIAFRPCDEEEAVVNDEVHSDRHDLDRAVLHVLRLVSVIADEPDLAPVREIPDLKLADIALGAAESLLTDRISAYEHRSGSHRESELAAGLIQVMKIRTSIKEQELARRSAAVSDVHAALQRLRSVETVSELVERAPIEVSRLGFQRALFSLLSGSRWVARSAFAHEDPWMTEQLVQIGSASPGLLGRELPETDLVRRRSPILIPDAQHNPTVHQELFILTRTKNYVAAPLIARGGVVGLMHADQNTETGTVSTFDRDLLGLFMEGMGFVLDRTLFHEQLKSLRGCLEDNAGAVGDLIDGFLIRDTSARAAASVASRSAPLPALCPAPAPVHPVAWPLTDLTRRELEVLQRLANGESNRQIAANLYVSVATVKTHVKNLLRKLGVPNRIEAVSRYGHLMRSSPHG